MFKIYDGREFFYQWDIDRKIIVEDETITQVHYCNRTGECSLVCEVKTENGQRVACVPNILLQTAWNVNVFAYDGNCTKYAEVFTVKARTKPENYIYTETEHFRVEKVVEEAVKEALKSCDFGVDNHIGTKAFRIVGYEGQNGGRGKYYFTKDAYEEFIKIDYSKNPTISLHNGMWFDGIYAIGVELTENNCVLTVDNFYSNEGGLHKDVAYDSAKTYKTSGTPYAYSAELGYTIQNENAELFFHGYSNVGQYELNKNGTAFGAGNYAQGEYSFASGANNQAFGTYSTALGANNKAGYNTHCFGRNLNGTKAIDGVLVGHGHTVTNNVNSITMAGYYLKGGYNNQTIFGTRNKNKSCNIIEIGTGNINGNPYEFNGFELDANGLISANEKYIPNQTIFEKTLVLSKPAINILGEAVDGVINGVSVESGTTKVGQLYHKPKDLQWVGYVMVNKNTLGLKAGTTYYLTVKYIINQTDNAYDKLTFAPIYSVNAWGATQSHPTLTEKYESRTYYITVPFTVTDEYLRYGVFLTGCQNKEFDITVDADMRLYEAYDFSEELPVNAFKSDLLVNGVGVSKENNMMCNFALPSYMANIRYNYTQQYLRIVPTDDINVTKVDVKMVSGKPLDYEQIKYLKGAF